MVRLETEIYNTSIERVLDGSDKILEIQKNWSDPSMIFVVRELNLERRESIVHPPSKS
jgi:hypothetical protein